ncbi:MULTISPECIES: GntR family transcriptional regulator [unclassified Pseudomonas]|uniref:GntR family transcriptional regulator n=1 Tax=unclassified Pseudomonas TaxID=196821 RepID=UPI0021C98C47|nr:MULTISPECIES: GntR family transcriptional regulator [unclassified Pseudomonas]MCU1732635.1 GntR family transcriptional regulator [Pseudomonas sp. 20P_3.2_Bac4]MCU1743985.1 GntR family transcriptional regulator [Pseudomonas sp. 20P_3.2_Bac5]
MSGSGQRVLNLLRRMILDGRFAPGERIAEIPTAELLEVSRMPVRMAFRALEQEGLLVRQGARGFAIKQVTAQTLSDAVEVRAVLEGLAARQAAENGLSKAARAVLQECLEQADQLFEKGHVTEDDLAAYHDINKRFHQTIIEASGNGAVAEALSRNEHLPFASVSSIAVDRNNLDQEFRRFNFANMQHHMIVDALLAGQSARAEAIMREHANVTIRYMKIFSGPRQDGLKIIQ